MAVRTISTKLAIEGEQEYKRSIADINSSLKTLQSELQKVESQYQDNANSVKAVQAKKDALLKIQDKEREKLKELKLALENAQKAQKQHADSYASYSAKVSEAERKLAALKNSTGDTAEEQKKLTQELEEYKKAQAQAKSYQDAATRGVEEWQTKVNRAEKDVNDLTSSIKKTNKALVEAKSKFKEFSAAADNLNSVGNKLSVGLTAPLTAAGTAAVSYASNTDEALNKVEVAFGDSANIIKQWSDTTLTSLGLAKGTALDMAALYGDMATAMGFTDEKAAEMSKSLVSLAADLASFKNISIETANTALKSIFTGETESLKNLGVVMTETNLSNYAMSQGFKETYSQMNQAEKVALRYQYVMEMTANAQGDFARTSDGTANQLRILQESLKEAAATLGSELLPIVTPIIQNLGKLIQSFTDLDEGTRKAVVQVGLFLAALGPSLKLTGGFTNALGSAIKALFSLKAAQAGATTGQLALNAAIKSNGITALISVLGSAAAALISWIASSKLAKGAQEDFNDELKKAQETLEESQTKTLATAAVAEQYIDKLKELEATGLKTDEQQKEYHNTLVLLTRTIPELADQIDLQTDKINGGTEALEKNTAAWVENAKQQAYQNYLNTLYEKYGEALQDAAENEIKLTEAKQKREAAEKGLDAAIERRNELYEQAQAEGRAVADEYYELGDAISEYELEIFEASKSVDKYQKALDESNETVAAAKAEMDSAKEVVDEIIEAFDTSTNSMESNSEQAEQVANSAEALEKAQKELEEQTKSLTKANDMLSSALKEQESNGSLSLDTTLQLIDAGYAAALAIDEESGAVTIDQRAYVNLAKSKIEEQIATLNAKIASEEAQLTLREEAYEAAMAANSYIGAAEAKAVFAGASTEEIAAMRAQKAALEQTINQLGNYPPVVSAAAGASKAMTTQAQKDAETFKKLQKDLDHQRNMDLLSDKEYYEKLQEYRDKYLTDDSNLDEYRKITEEIFKYDKQLADEENELWEKQTNELIDTLEDRLNAVKDKQEDMADKMSDYGDLFKIEDDGSVTLGDLQEQTDAIEEYGDVLDMLKEKGVSDGILQEILSMDVDEATAYGKKLLEMSDEDFEKYNGLWEEKQKTAQEISARFYANELKTLEEEYNEKLGNSLDTMKDTAFTSGEKTGQGLLDGLSSKEQEIYAKARSIADEISRLLSAAYPEEPTVDGSHAGGLPFVPYDGYMAELHQGERVLTAEEAKAYLTRSIPSDFSVASGRNQGQEAVSAMVNGIAGVMSQTGQPSKAPIQIKLVLENGKELASVVYDPIKDLKKQRGD